MSNIKILYYFMPILTLNQSFQMILVNSQHLYNYIYIYVYI